MKLENNRKHFFQWDTGCRLALEEPADRVDFAVTDSDSVYSVMPEGGFVRVPDVCLQSGGTLEVYAVRVPADGQQTVKRWTFPILPRQKPEDYIYTPQEHESYAALSLRLDGKLTAPEGGEPGQVLTKTVGGIAWTDSGGSGAGTTFYPHVSADGILTWTNDLGLPNPDPVDLKGTVGADGFTPTVTVEAVEDGFMLTITNRDGVNRVLLPEAAAGGDGQSGATFTPHMSEDGVLTWTNDKGLSNPAPVSLRGADGAAGATGATGATGAQGPAGQTGAPGADGYTPQKGVDYFTSEDIAAIRQGLLPTGGGTMNGSVDMGGNRIRNLGAPVDGTDAASKDYVDAARLIFQNVQVNPSDFAPDAAYADYPYKADISLPNVRATMIPEAVFPVVDFALAPVCESYNGGVSVWADAVPEKVLTIPTMILWRGDSV